MQTSAQQQPVRYRWVNDRRAVAPFLPGALIGRFVVEPIIGRRGVTVGPDGLTVHRMVGKARHIGWSDVRSVERASGFSQGEQLVVVLGSDERVKLPAPTSKTKGDVSEAQRRIEAFLG